MTPVNYLPVAITEYSSAYRATEIAAHVQYLGWADPGTLGESLEWKLCKVTYDTATDLVVIKIEWPNGSRSSTYEWDERASYTYT